MTTPPPAFLFATCNPGREPSLKAEMKRRLPEARPAFLRPGLVTWKVPGGEVSWEGPPPVFAHVFGRSLGLADSVGEIAALLPGEAAESWRLHLFPRVLPEDGFTAAEWESIDRHHREVATGLAAAGVPLREEGIPRADEAVLDLVTGSPGEPLLVGWHRHGPGARPFPGGMPRAILPPDAPSRAWLKTEQALACLGWDGPRALEGWRVLELGCAPGGGTLALLARGAQVFGVDTAEMDPRVAGFPDPDKPTFRHLVMSAGEVDRARLPGRFDLIASDMNLAPPVALRYVERLQRRLRARGLLLTLKINDKRMEEAIPAFLEQVRRFAPGEPLATQLPANRSEITVLVRPGR